MLSFLPIILVHLLSCTFHHHHHCHHHHLSLCVCLCLSLSLCESVSFPLCVSLSVSRSVCLSVCPSLSLSLSFSLIFNKSFQIINTTRLHDKLHRPMPVLISYKRVKYERRMPTEEANGLDNGRCVSTCCTLCVGVIMAGNWSPSEHSCVG